MSASTRSSGSASRRRRAIAGTSASASSWKQPAVPVLPSHHVNVFAPGQYQPHSEGGQHLLAHELAHTVQQKGMQRSGI